MNKCKEIADEIVREYFGGYLPNSLADEGMACATDTELYSLVEKIEMHYMNEYPSTDFGGDEDTIHHHITDIVQELNSNSMAEKKQTTLADRPINPRTGRPYKEGTKKFNEWWENLSENDAGVYADLTAELL